MYLKFVCVRGFVIFILTFKSRIYCSDTHSFKYFWAIRILGKFEEFGRVSMIKSQGTCMNLLNHYTMGSLILSNTKLSEYSNSLSILLFRWRFPQLFKVAMFLIDHFQYKFTATSRVIKSIRIAFYRYTKI